MAKTISLSKSSINFGNVDIYKNGDDSFVIQATGDQNVAFTSIASNNSKFTVRKGTDAFSSSVGAFSITAGNEFVRQFGGAARDYCYDIQFYGNNTFFIAGYSLPGTPFDGTVRTNSTNYAVWVQKYTISSVGIITKAWTRILDDAVNDFWTGGDCLAVDGDGNIWVSYVSNPSGSTGVNGKVYVTKIQNDNSAINSLLVYDGTGETIFKYTCPITYWNGFIFCGHSKITATPNAAYIARINVSAVTLAENKVITGASTTDFPVAFRNTGSTYLDVLFAHDTGASAYVYALFRMNLDGSNNIVEYDYVSSDAPSYHPDPYTYRNEAMIMQNQFAYLVKSEDLFFAEKVNFGNLTYYDVSGTAGSRLKSLKSEIYSVDGTLDFQEEFEVQFNSIAADAALSSEYIGAGDYRIVYFENANQRIIFKDQATTDTITTNNNVITSTATVYKIRVSRINGVGKIEIDSGAGYTDQTASESMASTWSTLETHVYFGIQVDGGGFDGDINLFFWKRWISSVAGVFGDAQLKIHIERAANATIYDHFIVNRAVGSYSRSLGNTTNYYVRAGDARSSDKTIFIGGRVAGIEYQSGVGVPAGTGDPIYGIYDVDGLVANKQFSVSSDGFVEGLYYDASRDIVVGACFAREGFEGQTNPGPGNYSAVYFGMTTAKPTALKVLPGETQTIDVRYSPDLYKQTHSGTLTLTSDAASSPDSITLAGECQPEDLEVYEIELISDMRLDAISRIFYGKAGFEKEIVEANPHFTKEMIKTFFIPAYTKVVKPEIDESATTSADLPIWRI